MNITLDLMYAVAALSSCWMLCRLLTVFSQAKPHSARIRLEFVVLVFITGLLLLVNGFFWIPNEFLKSYPGEVAIGIAGIQTLITLSICFYDHLFSNKLSIQYQTNTMPTGALVPMSVLEEWQQRFREARPDAKHGYFFDADFIARICSTPGAQHVNFNFGINDEGNETMIVFPSDEAGDRIPLRSEEPSAKMGIMGVEDEDYGGDHAGATPPGPGGGS